MVKPLLQETQVPVVDLVVVGQEALLVGPVILLTPLLRREIMAVILLIMLQLVLVLGAAAVLALPGPMVFLLG
jgi:hypothetical protein